MIINVIPRDHLLPIIGIGAVATAAVSYIVWGGDASGNRDSRKHRKVAGLENLGNTCYLNTILQSLAACPKFIRWLQRALRNSQFKGKREDLAYKLSKTLEVVNDYSSSHAGTKTYSPHDVLYALHNCNWRHDREQQDCHELFQFLLNELQEDAEKLPPVLSLSEASQLAAHKNGVLPQSSLRSNINVYLPPISTRGLELPFRGLIAHHLSCTACGHKNRVTYSQFDCLSVYIPVNSFGMTSLDQMLEIFTQVELVHDVECTECLKKITAELSSPTSPTKTSSTKTSVQSPSPVCKRVFQKQMTIAKLPQCLCIHVQRVMWTPNGEPMRRGEHVMFPEKLDMATYRQAAGVSQKQEIQPSSLPNGVKGSKNSLRDIIIAKNNFIGESFLSVPNSLPVIGCSVRTQTRLDKPSQSSIGSDSLDICSSNLRSNYPEYQLMSAVVHMGDATSGHFLTYRRVPVTTDEPVSTKWLCISDEHVTSATLTDVLSQKAYMLYYQRM